MEQSEIEELAKIGKLISHPNRLAIIYSVDEGISGTELSSELEITRQTLQGHVDKLKDGGILEYSSKENSYKLTNLGKYTLDWVEEGKEIIQRRKEIIQRRARDKLEEIDSRLHEDLEEYETIVEYLEKEGVDYEPPLSNEVVEELKKSLDK